MDGTRVDIIRELVARLTSAPDSIRLVMLSGVAGSGKSTITKTVAAILAEEKQTLAASFFFSRGQREIDHFASTLALQLAQYSPDFQDHLIELLEKEKGVIPGIGQAGPHLQFQKLVVGVLVKLPPCSTPWVICLDALDECGQDRGQNFLSWLFNSIDQIPAHI
jgi:predicted ATPase